MPELTFDTLDAVPEGLREFAKETETGKVAVNVVPKARVDEFRENNVKLAQERDGLVERIRKHQSIIGEDLDAFVKDYESLKQMKQRVKNGELVENHSLDEALAKRTGEMRGNYEAQIAEKAKEAEAWRGQTMQLQQKYNKSLIDRAITDAVLNEKSGLRPDALPDILTRAYNTFKVGDDGSIVPYNGDAKLFGADGVSPMTPAEWAAKLRETSPWFAKESRGGGAMGGGADPGSGSVKRKSDLKTPADKAKFIGQYTYDAYANLPD